MIFNNHFVKTIKNLEVILLIDFYENNLQTYINNI